MKTTAAQHQVIEASAGTGKTYTIESEVVHLIMDEGIPLTRILIVTFTEKATAELRRRVRKKLEAEWRRDPDAPRAGELRAGLDAFDDAAIHTIHGFCARVLHEYAFEARLPFIQQQLDDPLVWDRLFARSLRGFWRRTILTDDDPRRSREAFAAQFYRQDILEVARKLMPGDKLIPDPAMPFSSYEQEITSILNTLGQTFGNVPDDPEHTAFLECIDALDLYHSTIRSLRNQYVGFFALLQQYQRGGLHDEVTDALLAWKPNDVFTRELPTLINHSLLRGEDADAFRRLADVQQILKAGVLSHAVRHLADSMHRLKREGGLIDFNDMLLLVQEALTKSPELINLLRKRFTAALVDEFQDTDQVQWDIFRTLFTGDDDHRLIVVGDPKQAIYSFRGANVNVYLAARDELSAQSAAPRALNTNWRAYPPLIGALNKLFSPASQWFGNGTIQHRDIDAPGPGQVRARLYADQSSRRPLTLVQLPDAISGGQARTANARFIAGEIQHLLDSQIEIVEWQGTTPYRRPLHPGDICILIQKRPSDLPAIDRALRRANIPYSFPKQGGLFSTMEARLWRYLLRAIATPDDPRAVMTVLLTRIFACSPDAVESYPVLPGTHPVKQTFARWHVLAEQRAWAPLFQAIFADTGLLVRELSGEKGERAVTNHQHLAQLLHEQAIRSRGSIDDLIAFLDSRCLSGGDEETDLQRLETERRKVQVMTMHAVKGLEFPVVFIAGGFTAGNRTKGCPSYTTATGRVYAFDNNEAARGQQNAEIEQDLRRLYYVALTRAKFKLYVPFLPNPKRKSSGPLATFVSQAITEAWSVATRDDDKVAYLPVTEHGRPASSDAPWQAPVDDSTEARPAATTAAEAIDDTCFTLPCIDSAWGRRVTRVASYSSLAGQEAPTASMPVLQYAPSAELTASSPRVIDDDAIDMAIPTEHADGLPPGTATGTLLHAVLEAIDYPAVLAADSPESLLEAGTATQACIERLLERHLLGHGGPRASDRVHLARTIWLALRTPMPFLDDLPLAAVADRRHEVEFWLPAPGLRVITVPDLRLDHAYLSGFIDLIFRHQGRYHILDWKSNWSPSGDYGRQALERIMIEHQYDLQYRTYLVALDRLLQLSIPGYEPASHLGDICYLFLRGVGQGDAGIYHVAAETIDIAAARDDLLHRLLAGTPETGGRA